MVFFKEGHKYLSHGFEGNLSMKQKLTPIFVLVRYLCQDIFRQDRTGNGGETSM